MGQALGGLCGPRQAKPSHVELVGRGDVERGPATRKPSALWEGSVGEEAEALVGVAGPSASRRA